MILITLLLVLTIERIAATADIWQFSFYYQKYFSLWSRHLGAEKLFDNRIARYCYLFVPVFLVAFVSVSIQWILIDLIFNTLVLLICVGCIHKRRLYKQFLNAANRGDEQACHLYAKKLHDYESFPPPYPDEQASKQQEHLDGQQEQSTQQPDNCDIEGHRLGLTLVWFNFKYYCAVLFWFVCVGPAGAVAYCMLREAFDDKNGLVTLRETAGIKRLLHLLDWIPARVCSAGYLLIGDFTRSSGIWLGYLLDFKSPAKNLVCDIASAAEAVEFNLENRVLEPVCMLKLAKRNILFFLAMVAVLTLYGGIA